MTEMSTNSETELMAVAGAFPWWIALIWGLVSVLLGIFFLVTPLETTLAVVTFIGAWWFIGGIFQLFSLAADRSNMALKIILALLSIIAGIIILAYPIYSTFFLVPFLVILIGVCGCIIGLTTLYQGYKTRDIGHVILGILSIIFAVLILVYPVGAALALPFVVGIFALAGGIAMIISSLSLKKAQDSQPA